RERTRDPSGYLRMTVRAVSDKKTRRVYETWGSRGSAHGTSAAFSAPSASLCESRIPPGIRRPMPLQLHGRQPLADGVLGQLGHAVQVELFHDLPAVGLDRLDADVEQGGHLLGGLPLGHE